MSEIICNKLEEAAFDSTNWSFTQTHPDFSLVVSHDMKNRPKGFTVLMANEESVPHLRKNRSEIFKKVDYVLNNDDLDSKGKLRKPRVRSSTILVRAKSHLGGLTPRSESDSIITEEELMHTIVNEYVPDLSPNSREEILSNKGENNSSQYFSNNEIF